MALQVVAATEKMQVMEWGCSAAGLVGAASGGSSRGDASGAAGGAVAEDGSSVAAVEQR